MLSDFARDARITDHDLVHGDVLILATDGVWDNLSSQQVLGIIGRLMRKYGAWNVNEQGTSVGPALRTLTTNANTSGEERITLQGILTTALVTEAKMASLRSDVDGPFANAWRRQYSQDHFRGGKVDDICVVVAIPIEDPEPPHTPGA